MALPIWEETSLARTLNYVVLLSIVAMIVAASGCSSNTPNNTSAPATTTPEPSATPVETTAIPVETSTPLVTPAYVEETPGATENTTSTSVVTGTYVENGTHISTNQRNLQIEQSNAGVTSTASNGTLTVKVSSNTYGLQTNPLSTAKQNTNPLNNTGNNNAAATNTGTLKIIPANGSTTNATGNQTINIGTTQRKLQIKQAQSGNSGAVASQNVTSSVTVTASNSGY
jgi:hypothetical protein